MKKIFYLFFFVVVASCQTKTVSETKVDSLQQVGTDTASNTVVSQTAQEINLPAPESFIVSNFSIDIGATDALVSWGTRVYTDSIDETTFKWETNAMEPVSINQKTLKTYPESIDLCERNYCYNVTFLNQNNSTGWINSVDIVLNPFGRESKSYNINGTEYLYWTGIDSGIGPSDEDGLTGCDQYVIPYFYDPAKKTISFLALRNNVVFPEREIFVQRYGDWLSFISSEGGGADVTDIESEGSAMKIHLQISYQDGGAKAIIYADENNGIFNVRSIEVLEDENEQSGQ